MPSKTATIRIKDKIAPILSSRDVIELLKKIIDKIHEKKIIFDFDEVEFISRSAAQELINLKSKFRKKFFHRKYIYFDNVSKEVQNMFKLINSKKHFRKNDLIIDIQESNFQEFLQSNNSKCNL